jgi:formylglycine-generating enzyme required for sulfatase activity
MSDYDLECTARGGSWYATAWFARVAYRLASDPSCRVLSLGLRLSRKGG